MKQRLTFRFGRFELRPADHLLLEAGVSVRLTPKAFDTLAALVRRHGAVLTRDELIREVWPDTFVEEGGLTQNISVLRKLLNKPGEREAIETVARRGYRFAADVEEVRSGGGDLRIAVLPFMTDGADPLNVDLGDGLAADVIDALATLPSLKVNALSTVGRYRGRDVDPCRAARDLRVDVVLIGRLRLHGSEVSLGAELVDGDDGSRLWAHRFECDANGLQAMPREAATRVGQALGLAPASYDRRAPSGRDRHADAYRDYLEGRHHLAQRTVERIGRAVTSFERAIQRDADYALAYAGMAEAYTLAASAEFGGGRWAESMARAKSAAMRALALDEDLAQAHASLALVHFRLDWNWALAEEHFRRALALNPRDADVHHAFALYLVAMERRDEAWAEAAEAHRLQPMSLIIATGLGRILHFSGEHERAIDEFERVIDVEPSFAQAHFDLSLSLAQQGRFDAAIRECRAAIGLAPQRPVSHGVLGHLLARAGHVDEARTTLAELDRLVATHQASRFDLALVYAGLADVDRACDALEAACRERHGLLVYLRIEPLWNPLRGDVRFDRLLREIGLVQAF
jgi:eukaryotic-like serine/threonine-protein kinase